MSKRSRHVCQACGTVTGKWSGRCDACGAWNTIFQIELESAEDLDGQALPITTPVAGNERFSSRS